MNKTESTLLFIVIFAPFIAGFGYLSLIMISIGSIHGIILGIAFLFTTLFCGLMILGWWKRDIKAIAKQEEIEKHSISIKSWGNSTATLVEWPKDEQGITRTMLNFGKLNFCLHLENVTWLNDKVPQMQTHISQILLSTSSTF